MRTRRGPAVPDRCGSVLPAGSCRGIVRKGRVFRLGMSSPAESGGIPSVKTSSSHGTGAGTLWKPRGTDCTKIATSPVSTAVGGTPASSRSSGIARMKERTRCGVTASDVGIESLRGRLPAHSIQIRGLFPVYTSFRNCQRAISCDRNGTTSGLPPFHDRRRTRTWRGTRGPLSLRGRTGTISRQRHAKRGKRRRPGTISAFDSGEDRRDHTARPSTDRRPGDDKRRNHRSMAAGDCRGPDRGRERMRLS